MIDKINPFENIKRVIFVISICLIVLFAIYAKSENSDIDVNNPVVIDSNSIAYIKPVYWQTLYIGSIEKGYEIDIRKLKDLTKEELQDFMFFFNSAKGFCEIKGVYYKELKQPYYDGGVDPNVFVVLVEKFVSPKLLKKD